MTTPSPPRTPIPPPTPPTSLPETFPEFAPYLGQCRFVGCSHVKEKGCALLQAVKDGRIPASRHRSYVRLYDELKDLRDWQHK